MRDRVYIPQFDRFVGKETECPFGVALGWFPAGHGDDVRLDVPRNFGFDGWCLPLLPVHGSIQASLSITGADFLDCSGGSVEGDGCLLDGHGLLPVLVYGKEDIRPQDSPGWHLAGLHNLGQLPAFGRRQAHLVLQYRHNRIVLSIAQQRYNYYLFYAIFRCYKILGIVV